MILLEEILTICIALGHHLKLMYNTGIDQTCSPQGGCIAVRAKTIRVADMNITPIKEKSFIFFLTVRLIYVFPTFLKKDSLNLQMSRPGFFFVWKNFHPHFCWSPFEVLTQRPGVS